MSPHPLTNFEIRNYNQNEPNLMVLIHEIITENKRWDIYNES